MNAPEPSLESLMAQHDWLRRLVHGLVRDSARADDVLQTAWLRLLRRPPRAAADEPAWRAWIARVVRTTDARQRRDEVARRRRDERSARGEWLPSTDEIAEREELRARLVAHVLALPEPYRSTLVLRFYDELSPRAIAREQGVNASTVRTRIARGLALLRERVEREEGRDWLASCLLALPLRRVRTLATQARVARWITAAGIGGVVMKKAALVVAAAVLATSAWVWMRSTAGGGERLTAAPPRDETPAVAGSEGKAPNAAPPAVELANVAQPPAVEPPAPREALAAAALPADVSLARVHGRVSDAHGAPLVAAPSPESSTTQTASEQASKERVTQLDFERLRQLDFVRMQEDRLERVSTNEAAAFQKERLLVALDMLAADQLRFAGASNVPAVIAFDERGFALRGNVDDASEYAIDGLHPGRWTIVVTHRGKATERREIELAVDERDRRVDFVLRDAREVTVILRTPDGRPLEQAIAADAELSLRVDLVPVALRRGSLARLLPVRSSPAYGAGRFTRGEKREDVAGAIGVLRIEDGGAVDVGLALNQTLIARQPLPDDATTVEFVVGLDELRQQFPDVRVRVVDARTRAPIAGAEVVIEGCVEEVQEDQALVEMSHAHPRAHGGQRTDSSGYTRHAFVPAGARMLHVEAAGYARFAQRVTIEPGELQELEAVAMSRSTRIRGRIVGSDGQPAQVSFVLLPVDRFEATHTFAASAPWNTDERGTFDVQEQRRERYMLRVTSGDDVLAPVILDASAGDVDALELHLTPAVDVELGFASEPAQDAELRVLTAAGLPVLERDLVGRDPSPVRLATGSYVAEVRERGRCTARARFSVRDTPMRVTLGTP